MGGNVFAGKTARIKLEHIEPTLITYFDELERLFPAKAAIFNSNNFVSLGSVGKVKSSGDIDLGIGATDLLDNNMSDESIAQWGIDPARVSAEFAILTKRARTSTPAQLKMKAFLKELTLYINENAPKLHCDEKKVTDSNIFGLYPQINQQGNELGIGVQIDWMVGDLKWLQFSYYSAVYPEGSNVKGLHRTQLMLAAFQVANMSFNHASGVKDKVTGCVIATVPKQALAVLSDALGFEVARYTTEDYYKLHALLKTNMKPDQYNALLDIYFKILDSTRTDIPDDMQNEWRARKDQLRLTGKFLPETSALLGCV